MKSRPFVNNLKTFYETWICKGHIQQVTFYLEAFKITLQTFSKEKCFSSFTSKLKCFFWNVILNFLLQCGFSKIDFRMLIHILATQLRSSNYLLLGSW